MTELTPPRDWTCVNCGAPQARCNHVANDDYCCSMCSHLPTPPRDTTDTEALRGEVEALCVLFHNTYEDAALDHGWETQEGSRKPWDDVPEANKETMRTTIASLLAAGYSLPDPTRDAALRAEALREAATAFQMNTWADVITPALKTEGIPALAVGQAVIDWLRERADRIAAGGAL